MVTCIHSYVDVLGSLFNCSLAHSHMTCTDYSQLKSYLLLVTCISVCIHSFKPITYSISLCTLLLHVDVVGWFHCHMTCIDYCQSSSLSLVTFISVDIHLYVFTFTCNCILMLIPALPSLLIAALPTSLESTVIEASELNIPRSQHNRLWSVTSPLELPAWRTSKNANVATQNPTPT